MSRFSELFVIARNSSFQYKGKSVDVRQVGRELGVRYVLEGSIRRAGDRVRISAQLIEATTGAHRWAERYDRKLENVFAVQDEVARTIVAVLAVHVNKAETERALAKPPATWQAYDHYLRAADTLVSTIPLSTKRIFFKLEVDYAACSSTPTTRGLMPRYQEPTCLYGPIGGTTIVPGLQPSTAPINLPVRRCAWPPICLQVMWRLALL